MSRREIVVNTLLGMFLLLVFLIYYAAIGLAFLFGFIGLDWIAHRVVPGWNVPAGFSVFGAWVLFSLWYVIRDLREKRWKNALLFFVCAPLMGFAWFTPIRSSLGGNGHQLFFWFPVIVILGISNERNIGWLKFSLATALAGTALLVNSGLLGNGPLARTVANCDLALAVAWWIAAVLTSRTNNSLDQSFTFPPAGA